MRSRMACDVLMAASVLDNLPKYLTVHKAHVVNKKPLRLSSGNQGRRTPPAKRRLVRKLPTLKWWQRRLIAWLRLYFPWLTRFMRFSPGAYIRWLQAKARRRHAVKIAEGRGRRANARLGKKSPAG